MDAGEDEALCGMRQKGQEVGLLGERREQGHGGGAGPGGVTLDLCQKRAGVFLPALRGGLELGAHEAAEGGLGGGELWGG